MTQTNAAPAPRSVRIRWIIAILAPIMAVAVIRPDTPSAFPVWDYDDMLPLFRQSHGMASAFHALAAFTRLDGRANYLTYLYLAATWGVAGDNPVAWQWHRAALMLVYGVLFVLVARRLGATPVLAAIAALILMLSVPSTEGWLFLMGEPLATILLLVTLLVAFGYRTAERWRWRAGAIAVLCMAVLMTKEVLGICLPAIVAVAVCWEPGTGWRWPRFGLRERWLGIALLVVLLLETTSVVSALAQASPHAYARSFAEGSWSPRLASVLFQGMLLPDRFTSAAWWSDLYPGNLAYVALLVMGALAAQRLPVETRRRYWQAAALLVSVPLVGALVYSFWPRYSAFYGIPFFAASVGLFLLSGVQVSRGIRGGRWLAAAAGLVVVWYTAPVAGRTATYKRSVADVAAKIVRTLPALPRLDTVFIVTPAQDGRRWPITSTELAHYARALQVPDSTLPAFQDASCEAVAARLQRPLEHTGVLNDVNPCGPLPHTTLRWVAVGHYVDWPALRDRPDTVMVEILAPAWAEQLGSHN